MDQEKKQKFIKETKSLVLLLLGVLVFRSTFFEPFRIPSGSMIPSLMIGDFVLVSKMSYGFKVPFSDWFGDPIYMSGPAIPDRGDIIVFKYPKDPSIDYIKRVVAIPGDTVEVREKIVYVNDKPVTMEEFTGSPEAKEIMDDMDDKFTQYEFRFYKATNGTHKHNVQIGEMVQGAGDFERRTVSPGHLFVMGDNRDFSGDSRVWGFVPTPLIKGKALFVWFSMIIPFLDEGSFRMRPWRIGTSLL